MQLRYLICGLALALTCSPASLLAQTPTALKMCNFWSHLGKLPPDRIPILILFKPSKRTDTEVTIIGTVTDVNGDGVVGATVVFDGPSPGDRRTGRDERRRVL